MKKVCCLWAAFLFIFVFTACGTTYTAEDIAGKTYVYEKDGCGGYFTIKLFEDGTFQYYEGILSSYIGMGTWTLDENILCLKDQEMHRFSEDLTTMEPYIRTNCFKVEKDCLVWLAENSDNFLYVDVVDGDRFFGEPFPTLPPLNEIKKLVLKENAAEEDILNLLAGFTCEDTEEVWGHPDGMCSGLWCNFWNLDENHYIGVYYEGNGWISEIKLGTKE